MSIGERIKKLRQNFDLSQSEFANKIGTTRQTISNSENNQHNVSYDLINKICTSFDINSDWLITGRGEMLIKQQEKNVYDISHLDDMIIQRVNEAMCDYIAKNKEVDLKKNKQTT